MRILHIFFAVIAVVSSAPGYGQGVRDSITVEKVGKSDIFKIVTYRDNRYFVCEIDPNQYKIELYNKLDEKNPENTFESISGTKKDQLVLIVNGGMFMEDLRPLGLYTSHGKTYMKARRDTAGYGNFYMQPNGIFVVDEASKPSVITTNEYTDDPTFVIATQSGPMLVTKGVINGHFRKGSANLNLRNGVGVNKRGNVVFVNSEDLVNFYDFAELYRDHLDCPNALYLDGFVSQYYAPEIQRRKVQKISLGVFIVVSRK
jgi:uncharacterized protein YigE (DUF2233 family)